MVLYRAYGLTIASDLPLPELVQAEVGPLDVAIRLGSVSQRPPCSQTEGAAYAVSPHDVCFFWERVGRGDHWPVARGWGCDAGAVAGFAAAAAGQPGHR